VKYRKKPVVIDAVQLTPQNVKEIVAMDGVDVMFAGPHHPTLPRNTLDCAYIRTLEGTMMASVGDWIITGVKGERYPCKPDIFEATYEPAN
jgi:hypothetical protein